MGHRLPLGVVMALALLAIPETACSSIVRRGEPEAASSSLNALPGMKYMSLEMPGAEPKGSDSYLCVAFHWSELADGADRIYVHKFQPLAAQSEKAHHLMLHSCASRPMAQEGKIYDCRHHAVCSGSGVMYAWAKNAPGAELPEDVAFELDVHSKPYIVLQVHYVKELPEKDHTGLSLAYSMERPKYLAGIYLLLRSYLTIPPHQDKIHGDMNCLLSNDSPMHPFAFRTHAHALGTVITGYKYDLKSGVWTEIARGSPQWPQSFYPMKDKSVTLERGDIVAARCTYNTTEKDTTTRIGATGGDEMCNLYLMYYSESGSAGYRTCIDEQIDNISEKLPADSDVPPPKNALLEEHAKHSQKHIKKGDLEKMVSDATDKKDAQKSSGGNTKKKDLDNPIRDEDAPVRAENVLKTFDISMPGAEPRNDDDYFCTAFAIKDLTKEKAKTLYITKFNALATAEKAHHLIVQKCSVPVKEVGKIWPCQHHATCRSQAKIVYAWARDAPPTTLPDDVGFKVDDEEDGFLVLQVHYKHQLPEKDYTGLRMTYSLEEPHNLAGIFLMFRGYATLPAHTAKVHTDMNCQVEDDISLFAFRTHAHQYGRVITGYHVSEGETREIARGDPQKPQTFYSMPAFVNVTQGDYILGRCTFDTTASDKNIQIGSTAGDEMCNLYLMFFVPAKKLHNEFVLCGNEQDQRLSKLFPENSDLTIAELSEAVTSPYDDIGQPELPASYSNDLPSDSSSDYNFVPTKTKKQYVGGGGGAYDPRSIYTIPQVPVSPPRHHVPLQPVQPIPPAYGYIPPQAPMYPPPAPQPIVYGHQQPVYTGGAYPQQPASYANYFDQAAGDEAPGGEGDDALIDEEPTRPPPASGADAPLEPAAAGRKKGRQRRPGYASLHKAKVDTSREPKQFGDTKLYPVPNWPVQATLELLGQLSGVSVDSYGNPIVFHRGDRTWNLNSFERDNIYAGDRDKPIAQDTILTLKKETGEVLHSFGKNMFFLPHMLTVDSKNNIWVTDVALHQVFKFEPYGKNGQALIVLGTAFVPGNDDVHFCKPTAVAVENSGDVFYVSDGYCNSRILKYNVKLDHFGNHHVSKAQEWGTANGAGYSFQRSPYAFNIPHALALAEDKGLICVADRENGRVPCFETSNGTPNITIKPDNFGSTIYAIDYASANGGEIIAVGGPEPYGLISGKKTQGYVVGIADGKIRSTFNGDGEGFKSPHDVAVTDDGEVVYEVELRKPYRVFKLATKGKGGSSTYLPTYPAVPGSSGSSSPAEAAVPAASGDDATAFVDIKNLKKMVPSSTMGVSIALASVAITCCMTIFLTCRKCKKRGKRPIKQSSKKGDGKLDLGDLLGRSKDGFQPLKQDEDDEDGAPSLSSSDDEDLEEFSVPALRA